MARWVRFKDGEDIVFAKIEGEEVAIIKGTPFGAHEFSGQRRRLSEIKLLPPVIPGTFYACGMNYGGHVRAMAEKLGKTATLPEKPQIGYRANSALIAHGDTVMIPADATENFHYEGELVAVIGKQVKHVSEADALKCIFGYTIGNDVSERSWQKADGSGWRGKNSDTFKPMGPWIETDVDLDALTTKVSVNGDLKIQFKTNDMLFSIQKVIATITRYITLYPGDVLWMGTEGASFNLKSGDVVDIEITGIGKLSNPHLRETAQ